MANTGFDKSGGTSRRAKPFIPDRPEDATPEWFTAALRDAQTIPWDVSVTSADVEPLGGGTGLAGETVRFRFTYDRAPGAEDVDLPETAIAKFASPLPVIKGLLESIDAYGREIAFYEHLSSKMPMRVPRFLGGGADPGRGERAMVVANKVVNGLPVKVHLAMTKDPTKLLRPSKRRYALLIEDLGDDLVVRDVVNPPAPEELRVPLAELAKLHAAFWGKDEVRSRGANGQLITSTPRLYQNVYDGRVRQLATEVWDDWLTSDLQPVVDEATALLAEDVAVINQGMTLVHGDPRSDNLLFSPDMSRVTFVDWSLPAYGHPGYDVGYLLSASLREDDAAGHLVPLSRHYLECLRSEGRHMNEAELWRGMRSAMRAMLAQQCQAIPHPLSGYGDKNLEDYWAPRLVHALLALPE